MLLWLPEDMPPAHVVQAVVLSPGFELLIVCESMVDPPDARGNIVGQQNVNRIVAP